jgi:hypothetical protein
MLGHQIISVSSLTQASHTFVLKYLRCLIYRTQYNKEFRTEIMKPDAVSTCLPIDILLYFCFIFIT